MKVLFVSSGNVRAGLNPIIQLQAESLSRQGVEIEHFIIFGKGYVGYMKNIFKIKKYLQKHPVDVIHAHFGFSCIVAQLAKGNIPLLVTLMGTDVMGHKDSSGNITFSKKLSLSINRFFANHIYDEAIVMSHKMKNTLKRNKPTHILSNGVNTEIFYPLDRKSGLDFLSWDPNKLHFIFLANPSRPEKNYALAKAAINLLQEKGVDVELHAVFQEKPENLKYYYAAATALLLPSFHEGSPNVVKECFACNCPIVFTNVGDVEETTSGVEGCFLAPYDIQGFAKSIQKCIDFVDKFGRIQGQQKIQDLDFDEKIVAKKIIEIYKKMMN
ncbi:glycosyltransferase family 4 protein [Mongoliitalea daihaiensis]|uniref:glycosyltransferase family 4 protein n=1 Tax=Mongoliitalea daihaiensis TaxID=2782006 RepID=UPI001F37F509|nr:glycosyltransferase family 4 protein [Mongoliitalea daihaiensis]UJP64871.1 glycosyltransferase family 4 protein [Mongoliitalea daihaiensis]